MQSDPMGAKIGTAPQSPRGLNQGTKVEEVVKNYGYTWPLLWDTVNMLCRGTTKRNLFGARTSTAKGVAKFQAAAMVAR